MKKLILTFGIILASVVGMQAQQATEVVQKRTAAMVSQMTAAAHLTPEQANKITPFVQQFVQTRFENRQKFANDANGMQTANKAGKEQLKSNLKTVLSDEQMNQLSSFYSNRQKTTASPSATGNNK